MVDVAIANCLIQIKEDITIKMLAHVSPTVLYLCRHVFFSTAYAFSGNSKSFVTQACCVLRYVLP